MQNSRIEKTKKSFFLLLNYNSVYYFFSAVILSNVIFGFISAVGGPLLPSIIIEFLGEENLAIGYGFLLIFEGLGSFVGPPLAGNSSRYHIFIYKLTSSSVMCFKTFYLLFSLLVFYHILCGLWDWKTFQPCFLFGFDLNKYTWKLIHNKNIHTYFCKTLLIQKEVKIKHSLTYKIIM